MENKYDIVIPGWNMPEMTVKCLKSIKKYTRNYRVIYVDNGSDPASLQQVTEVLDTMPHLLISFNENLGFIKATNAGIRASEAPFVILMNNDTEAVKEWTSKLIQPLTDNEKVVLSGPLTTTEGSWQGKYPKDKKGYVIRESGMLAFFCVMAKREVFRELGLLSESFGVGFGDDDEYCERIINAGYKMALVQDLVIPHHHRSTFKKIYSDSEIQIMQKTNLQKFRDKTYNINKPGNIDLVYVLGTGSQWGNNEIRYSIRSFIKHFKDLRNVVIVGELPQFLRGHIQLNQQDRNGVNKDCRMMLKILTACKDPRISENFVFCLDDTVLLKDLHFKDFTGWHEGPIMYDAVADMTDHKSAIGLPLVSKPGTWYDSVYNTGNELKLRQLPDNNYDRAHAPQPINKTEFIETVQKWNFTNNHYTVSNVYNNSSKKFTGEDIRGKNLKIYGPATTDQLDSLTTGKYYMNYNDSGLNEVMKAWLYQRFPESCKYEIFTTQPDRRTAAHEWIKSGMDYDMGVALFAQHAPQNVRLKKWFEINKGEIRAERKLKLTFELWLH